MMDYVGHFVRQMVKLIFMYVKSLASENQNSHYFFVSDRPKLTILVDSRAAIQTRCQ